MDLTQLDELYRPRQYQHSQYLQDLHNRKDEDDFWDLGER
jgi:hypothetical protein